MTSFSSIGAPVVIVVAGPKSTASTVSVTAWAASLCSVSAWLPSRRVTIRAWLAFSTFQSAPGGTGKNGRSAARMLPSLSMRRKSSHFGLSSDCSPAAAARVMVFRPSAVRAAAASEPGCSRPMLRCRIWPAGLAVSACPGGAATRLFVHTRALSGVTALSTPGVPASCACRSVIFCWFSGVNISRMLWPSGTWKAVSMASPPNRFW